MNGFGGRKRFLWVSRSPPTSWIPCRHRLCQQQIFFLNCKTCLFISVKWIKFSSDNTYCIKKGMNALYVRHKKKIRKTTCLYYIRWISKVIQERFVCSIYFSSLFSTNFICNTDLLITWYSFRAEYQVSNPTNILLYRTAYVNHELHWRIWPVKSDFEKGNQIILAQPLNILSLYLANLA